MIDLVNWLRTESSFHSSRSQQAAGDKYTEAADLIERLQQRNAELERKLQLEEELHHATESGLAELSITVKEQQQQQNNELAATVERLQDLITNIFEQSDDIEDVLRSLGGRNHILMANQIKEWAQEVEKLDSTDQQNLNAVKREVALASVLHAADEARRKCWSIDELTANAEQVADAAVTLANTKYPSSKDGE